jgi:hypothetical protein
MCSAILGCISGASSPSLSVASNNAKHLVDPYHEFRHLLITGRLRRPTGLKIDKVEVSLLPSVEMNHGQRKDHEPLAFDAQRQIQG